MKTIAELQALDSAFKNDQEFRKLRTRWNEDFDLYRLKPYDAGKGYYSYTTNYPRILATRGLSMLTSSKLSIRIPLDVLTMPERQTANNLERLMYGMLALNDERFVRLNMPSTIEQMAWYALMRGMVACRPYMYKNNKGKTIVDLAVWDPYTFSYQMGADGISTAIYTTTRSKSEVEDEYKTKISSNKKEVEVKDVWDEKENGVYVEGKWLKEPEKHGVDYCPAYIIMSGAQPAVSHETYTNPNVHRGESIFSMTRLIAPMMSKVLSDYASIVRRGVKVPIGYWSAGAGKMLEQDIFQVEKAGVVQLDSLTNEKIEPLMEPTMPADAKYLVDMMSGEMQRGGLTYIALGELGFRLSGFAINQLNSSINTIIEPFAVVVEKALRVCLTTLAAQYATGKYPDVAVRGRDSYNKTFGYPQALEIKPDETYGKWLPEVKLMPILPKDDAQRAQLAHMARADATMSLETIQDAILGLDDPMLEQERMTREWANNLTLNKLYDAYMAFVVDGQTEKAENVRMEMMRLMGSPPQQGGGGRPQGRAPTTLDAQAMGSPGVGVPPQAGAMNPELMPNEMLGGLPPGAAEEVM